MKTKTIQIEIPEGKRAEWVNGVLTLVDEKPKDVTERIKVFNAAYNWCFNNGKRELLDQYDQVFKLMGEDSSAADIIAYLRLRIITAALNEGWQPTFDEDEERYSVAYNLEKDMVDFGCEDAWTASSHRMVFKSKDLAEYAATQFKDIYADFYGCKKGGEG